MQSSSQNSNPILIAKALDIPSEYLTLANKTCCENGIELSFFLALSAEEVNYNPDKFTEDIIQKVLSQTDSISPYELSGSVRDVYDIYSKYFDDIKVSPIPKNKIITSTVKKQKEEGKEIQTLETNKDWTENQYETSTTEIKYTYNHYDDFGAARTFGGDRAHEGNDLIADAGVPIVSITDGIVRDMNWNNFGGYIVGVLTDKGTYFYYAHMQGFNTELHEGDRVKAGDILGYVGNTGYGPPGTSGKFVTHLHLQIGIKLDGEKERLYISPYNIVKYLDQFRVTLRE